MYFYVSVKFNYGAKYKFLSFSFLLIALQQQLLKFVFFSRAMNWSTYKARQCSASYATTFDNVILCLKNV